MCKDSRAAEETVLIQSLPRRSLFLKRETGFLFGKKA